MGALIGKDRAAEASAVGPYFVKIRRRVLLGNKDEQARLAIDVVELLFRQEAQPTDVGRAGGNQIWHASGISRNGKRKRGKRASGSDKILDSFLRAGPTDKSD